MINDWIDLCLKLSATKADFYAGSRKIIRARSFTFKDFSPLVRLEDAGYTKTKLTMLRRLYLHEESVAAAVKLWDRRKEQRKYGSVGFTTYNHFVKTDPLKKSKRASVMGPCIQSITLTYMNDHTCAVDAFYRTTELFKKFPADLVFIAELLERFDFSACPVKSIRFHFANITIHPMYFVTIIPHLDDPLETMERIRAKDEYFFNWVIKWTARYLIAEYAHGIAKFAQSVRVQKDALRRIDKKTMRRLLPYLQDNHPGYRGDLNADD